MNLLAIVSSVASAVRILAPMAQGVLSSDVGKVLREKAKGSFGVDIEPDAIDVAVKLVDAASNGIGSAISLVDQINSNETPSAAQLEAFLAEYDKAHDSLNNAIDEQIAKNNERDNQQGAGASAQSISETADQAAKDGTLKKKP